MFNMTHLLAGIAATALMVGAALPANAQSLPTTPAGPEAQSGAGTRLANGIRFGRIAYFPVWQNTVIDNETVAEIVDASADGMMLAYTDSELEAVGFVDISDEENPTGTGIVELAGEPTSLAFIGDYVAVAINTSEDFVNVSGALNIIDTTSREIVATLDLGGQPDAVSVSPDGTFIAVAIENERDEDLNDGAIPQMPAGTLVVVDSSDVSPANWTTSTVDLTGLADVAPSDPEPEFVDINSDNIAAVSLQENNHIVLVDLTTGSVTADFTAGTVDLENIDTEEEGIISFNRSQTAVPREPDGLVWLGTDLVATADEGDLDGGSRGWTVFNTAGDVVYTSGNRLDHVAARLGHYPEERSGNKGNEPENVGAGTYQGVDFVFVGSERSSLLFVYEQTAEGQYRLVQSLPTGLAPEGLVTIPSRDLLVSAAEDDERADGFRSGLTLYKAGVRRNYPSVRSNLDADGLPISWASLSGLTVSPTDNAVGYTVHDGFLNNNRIYRMDMRRGVRRINSAIDVTDAGAAISLDFEGIAARVDGGFWVVTEGNGAGNLLHEIDTTGAVQRTIALSNDVATPNGGLQGVAVIDEGGTEVVYMAMNSTATDDTPDTARIVRVDTVTEGVTYALYPLETTVIANEGTVGLTGLAAVDDSTLAVLEADDQNNDDATVKLVTTIDISSVMFQPQPSIDTTSPAIPTLTKTIVRDLLASGDLDNFGGPIAGRLEGLAIDSDGRAYIVNDNKGVDDSDGETRIIVLRNLF